MNYTQSKLSLRTTLLLLGGNGFHYASVKHKCQDLLAKKKNNEQVLSNSCISFRQCH